MHTLGQSEMRMLCRRSAMSSLSVRDLDVFYGRLQAVRRLSFDVPEGEIVAVGRALMSNPRLLLLDEPSHGLAPTLVEDVFRLIPRLIEDGKRSILLVEQNANKALTVASYGYVLETGSLALEGSTRDL